MYGEVVDGVDGHLFEEALAELKDERGAAHDVDLAADDLAGLVETFKAHLPRARRAAVPAGRARAARARRARRLRLLGHAARAGLPARARHPRRPRHRRQRRPDGLRQQGRRSRGPASRFTRDPSTGEPGLYGEFLADAQGEDVVAGIRTPEPLERMQERLPGGLRAARRRRCGASRSTTATCRTSSSRSRTGRLYLLQTRSAKRTAAAALKAAVDMVDEGLISREEAVARIDPGQLDQLLHPMIDPRARASRSSRRGLNASPGAASGKIVFDADTAAERGEERRAA